MGKKRENLALAPFDPMRDIVDEPISDTTITPSDIESVTESDEAGEVTGQSAFVEVPLGAIPNGYLARHVDTQLNTNRQRNNMRRMLQGLRQQGAKTENGRFVETNADAFRWFVEQLS